MQTIIPENYGSDKLGDDELDAIVAQLEAEKVTRAIAQLDQALASTGVSVTRLLSELADAVNVTACTPGIVETCGAQLNADGSVVRDAAGQPLPGELSHVPPSTDDEIDARNAALLALPAKRATALVAGFIARLAPALAPASSDGSALVKRVAREIEHLGRYDAAGQIDMQRVAAVRGRG